MIKLGFYNHEREFLESDVIYEFDNYNVFFEFMEQLNKLTKLKGIHIKFEHYMIRDTDINIEE